MGAVHVIADAGDGKSWVADKVIATGKPEPTSLVAQDADNNGAIDIVIGNKTASSVFLAKDTTQFVPASDAPCSVQALVDLNKDGVLDAVGNADGRVFVANGASPKRSMIHLSLEEYIFQNIGFRNLLIFTRKSWIDNCLNKGPTLSVIQSENERIFGGFTS
jgi:hypothetical protein